MSNWKDFKDTLFEDKKNEQKIKSFVQNVEEISGQYFDEKTKTIRDRNKKFLLATSSTANIKKNGIF